VKADSAKAFAYRCSVCGQIVPPQAVTYICPDDGGNLDLLLELDSLRVQCDPGDIARSGDESIWRYLPLLPVLDPGYRGTPLRSVGWTPFYRPKRLEESLGMQDLWLKDDGRNPTASFKDRASAVVVARALEIDVEVVITASTGNAGAALAGMAAAVGIPAVILAPKGAPQAKVAQLLVFGARVFLVDGSYDDAVALSRRASEAFGWYCRNTGYNPFTAEGKKTASFEICEQLSAALDEGDGQEWQAPDALFVSVGDGNIISGLHKGFKDLIELGWIEQAPRLFGVQSEGSAAIAHAFNAGREEIDPVQADTLADSISVNMPSDGLRALRAATQTDGAYIVVSDQAILDAMRDLAQEAAVFAEPAGAAAYAGLVEALQQGRLEPDSRVVVLNTGNGLKDVRAAMQATGEARVIRPRLEALQAALNGQGL
jgi:threonine synthase